VPSARMPITMTWRIFGTSLLGKYLLQLTSGNVLPWDPFRLYCFRAFGMKTFEILFVLVVGTTSKLILSYKICLRNENLMFLVYENNGRINFRQGVANGTHLQLLMWPCWFICCSYRVCLRHDHFISLFVVFVPSARHKVYYLFHLRNLQWQLCLLQVRK
jgi:hypothetical protein